MDFTADVTAQMKAFGITLTEEQAVAFTTYYERLVETNQYMNLTAITEPHEVAVKHMVDSLSCYDRWYLYRKVRCWIWVPVPAFRVFH